MKRARVYRAVLALLALSLMRCSLFPPQSPGAGPEPEESVLVGTDVPSEPNATEAQVAIPPTISPFGPSIPHLEPGTEIVLTMIRMFDARTGWAVGGVHPASDHVFFTLDGGSTWQDVTPPQPVPTSAAPLLATAYFLDTQTAWVTYYPENERVNHLSLTWRTEDGGVSWQADPEVESTSTSDATFGPYQFLFADENHGWLILSAGAGAGHHYVEIYGTTDGGASWEGLVSQETLSSADVHYNPKSGLAFADANVGLMTFGAGAYPKPFVNWTRDGGSTWER